MTALGVDIGGSSVKTALIRDGVIAATGQSPHYAHPTLDGVRTALRAALSPVLCDPDTSTAITTIGLCAPGLYDPATGRMTTSVNLPSLIGAQLADLLADSLASPSHSRSPKLAVFTDAHAAGFDFWSIHQPAGRLFAISLGTGVGACVLDAGEAVRLTGPSSGHFGQIDVSLDDDPGPIPIGPDGGRGSLEAYIGLPALFARYGPDLHGAYQEFRPAPPVRALARAVRIAHAIYRPDTIALLGGGGLLLAPLLPQLHGLIADHLTSLARPRWALVAADHAFHAAAGAARLAVRSSSAAHR